MAYDIYIRVSRLGDRTEDEATEIYEEQCRTWAARNGVEIDELVEDTDVSGTTAVEERKLDRLIQRIEKGESEGILTPYLDRFGRDIIHGAVAYRRIKLAGGRLVCTQDGMDSDRPGDELTFNLRMAIAQEHINRTRANFLASQRDAASRGVYLASRAPFGYRRVDQVRPSHDSRGNIIKDGALLVHEEEAELVRELFRRRAEGANWMELVRFLSEATGRDIHKMMVRAIIQRRAYVGEMSVQTERKGHPDTVTGVVPPLITEAQWQAAQITGTYFPRNGIIAKGTLLSGLVYCGSCGSRLKAGGYGKPGGRKAMYMCTGSACERHASMAAAKLDQHVAEQLHSAFEAREPHVMAIREGDTRYVDALRQIELAQAALAEFRDDVEMQMELGRDPFLAGLRARKADVEAKRKAMRGIPKPKERADVDIDSGWDAMWQSIGKDVLARYVARVSVAPSDSRRAAHPVSERVSIWWHGMDTQGDPAVG